MYSDEIERMLKEKGITPGDEVKVVSGKEAFEGVLIPRPEVGDSSSLVIKLKNGYNIGIKMRKGDTIKKLGSRKETFTFPTADLKEREALPRVTIITTGGTIGSKVDYETGGVYPLTKPEELLYLIPELSNIANIKIKNLKSVFSEDMTYKDWQTIAKEVVDSLAKGSRGIVITHGTDTMHFTSAALSFMLSRLNAPVVITGAQRSSDRGSSDAFMNLVCSVRLAAKSNIAEVGICMHASASDSICNFIRGTKVRKMHTTRRDAFRPINSRQIARIDSEGHIEYVESYKKMTEENSIARATVGYEPKVALLNFYPNSDPEIIDYHVGKGYKGIIIEGSGMGHVAVAPVEKGYSWISHIKNAIDSGVIVGMTSQCLNGRVNTNVYRNLRLISRTGTIYCEDMLPEVALVKLGFLLGNYSRDEAARMLNMNIAGEITERTEVDWF
jgi:glutamyl-tRNA(Gln) amidotransferase subunit D